MRETITFVLNNRVETVSGLRGDTTLLNWLRQTKRLTGSKEGCAEGDCGACTVAVLRPGDARWHPVNACILFLGMLEGASVTTVEGIASPDGSLHPCQQVMVDHHGSQCGFCTPAFMLASLSSTTKHSAPSTRMAIHSSPCASCLVSTATPSSTSPVRMVKRTG